MDDKVKAQITELVKAVKDPKHKQHKKAVEYVQQIAEIAKDKNNPKNKEAMLMAKLILAEIDKQQNKVPSHRLGDKLNYIKKLKGECPEGLEIFYFKKGNKICKACQGKKAQEGGVLSDSEKNTIKEWKKLRKNKRLDQASKDSIAANKFGDQDVMNNKPGNYKKGIWTPDRTKAPYKKK